MSGHGRSEVDLEEWREVESAIVGPRTEVMKSSIVYTLFSEFMLLSMEGIVNLFTGLLLVYIQFTISSDQY